jgi:hypothetical protein
MPFADYDAYLNALRLNSAADFQMSAATAVAVARFGTISHLFVPAPTLPTASVVEDKESPRSITGALGSVGSGRQSVLAGRVNPSGIGGVALMLVDLLNISGGLNATLTTQQTTNLPTAALTRYTSGEGVHAALVMHTSPGTTGTTVTVSYTNQSGTPGRISTAVAFGATGFRELGALIRLPLQAGDTGVRSVESVTLAATTGTAGNFGVLLYKPLALMFVNDVEGANVIDNVSSGRMVGQFAEVLPDACLTCFAVMPALQAITGSILLGEA